MATGRLIGAPVTGPANIAQAVACSPGGKTVASGSDDGTVRLWDVATGRLIGAHSTGHAGAVDSVAFSPDGKTLASGSDDGAGAVVGRGHRPSDRGPPCHGGEVESVAFSPDGKTLASGSYDHTIRLWDVATGRLIGPPSPGTAT